MQVSPDVSVIGLLLHDLLSSSALAVVQECPEEVFLEGVLQPCLEQGRLGALQALLEKLDPSLEASSRYLMASCQLLQRRSYYNTLYQLQQFMMVRNGCVVELLLLLQKQLTTCPVLTGSRARCHDLYQVLHTPGLFLPAAGRAAGRHPALICSYLGRSPLLPPAL